MRALMLAPIAAMSVITTSAAAQGSPSPLREGADGGQFVVEPNPSVPLTITFDGVLANDPAGNVRVGQPTQSDAGQAFTGSVPDYPYQAGDAVTFTITATVPSAQSLASGGYNYAQQGDGTYLFPLHGEAGASSNPAILFSTIDVLGPIHNPVADDLKLNGTGLFIAIDPASNSYSLSMNNRWSYGSFDAPGYNYDPISGALTPSDTTCSPRHSCTENGAGFSFQSTDLNSITTDRLNIYDADNATWGFFSLLFSGEWSVTPTNNGNPTPVPEPGMLLLFGAGAAAVFRRQRKKSRKQAA